MVGTCVKNFFKSLLFYFIPLGVMAFFVVLYLASAIPSSINLVKDTFQQIATKVAAQTYDWNQVSSILLSKGMEIYSDPTMLASLLGDSSQLVNLLKDTAMEAFGIESLTEEVVALLQNLVYELAFKLIGLVIIVILGVFFGFVFLEVVLRRFLTNVNMFKAILISLLNGIIGIGIFILLGYLNIQNLQVAMWIILVVAILAALLLSLVEAYLFYGIKKVRFLQVLNFKTIFTLLLGNVICIALCVGICLACSLIPSVFTRFFVMIPFMMLTLCVIELNAGAYVSKLVGENKIDKRVQKEVNKQLETEQQ